MPLMVLLGLGVRGGATPIDGFFQHARGGPLSWLLFFTDPHTANAVLLAAVVTAAARRLWALIPLIVVVPFAAVFAARSLKPMFGRMKEEGLAYPSSHATMMVVVLGMLVLAMGTRRRWLLWAVAAFAALGIVGQSVTYHYFTDTMGSVLLGTSMVAVSAAGLRWAHRRWRRAWLRLRL